MIINSDSFESLSSKEWIVTNGIGGFASGTVSNANTRRYHGLLVASFYPPTERNVIVSKLEEDITHENGTFSISSNQYPGIIHPEGYKNILSFDLSPCPKWIFQSGDIRLSKTVFMVYGRNITVIEYENLSPHSFTLEVTPLIVFRDYHHLRSESSKEVFTANENKTGRIQIIANEHASCAFIHYAQGVYIQDDDWYRSLEYEIEKERGLDFHEDAKCVGRIRIDFQKRQKSYIVLTTDEHLPDGEPAAWLKHEELRLKSLMVSHENQFIKDLVVSGDQFLVWRLSSKSHTLIAGYHWFTDWGRDTMIAMRGLIIACGKKQIAESIFLTFLQYESQGMIPNRFPDNGQEPEYNTIDASLWLFVALFEYYQQFNDLDFIKRVFPVLEKIINAHLHGTRYHIHVTREGLLSGGEAHIQLTWMDAKVDGYVVTPRQGCAVEINALWYNSLCIMQEFASLLDHPIDFFKSESERTRSAFRKYFINETGYLNDVVVPDETVDASIRPNQVYAISLPFSPLTDKEAYTVLSIIEEHLYTDLGLRSLSPDNPAFRSEYKGDQWERDNAYHQGTVWSYLWGEYALAFLRVHHYSAEAKAAIRTKSSSLERHFYFEGGIFAISEIFDGGSPSPGKGCIQQAWSVGMTLKALLAAEP